jgi:hypothetical protein
MRAIRVGVGLALLIAFAIHTSYHALPDVWERAPKSRFQEQRRDWDEERFTTLRPQLPARGTIGFTEDGADWLLTQYALAPLVVARDRDRDLVIATFDKGGDPPDPPGERYEVVFEDRERGVVCWKVK